MIFQYFTNPLMVIACPRRAQKCSFGRWFRKVTSASWAIFYCYHFSISIRVLTKQMSSRFKLLPVMYGPLNTVLLEPLIIVLIATCAPLEAAAIDEAWWRGTRGTVFVPRVRALLFVPGRMWIRPGLSGQPDTSPCFASFQPGAAVPLGVVLI